MSDERLRELERAWRTSGSVDDAAALLKERLRAGLVRLDVVEFAASLGHEAAGRLVGPVEPCPDDQVLPRLAATRGEASAQAGGLAVIAIAFAAEVAPSWTQAYGGDAAARAVRALSESVRCPCALHADAARLATACLSPPFVGGAPVRDGAERARSAAGVLGMAARIVEQHARVALGEPPDGDRQASRLQSVISDIDELVGRDRRRRLIAEALGGHLLALEPRPSTLGVPGATLPPRPPIDSTLGSLQTDLVWAREHLASFLAARATDPARAEADLGDLAGDLRDATAAVAEILRLVAAWDELRRRPPGE